jgi:phosphohistidine phosphatase
MKSLYVMRHAKSSWGEPGLDDFDRPLLEKGKKRTKNIIDYLLKKKVKPELIITSPAVRALETAMIMAHGLGLSQESIQIERVIYSADEEQIENLLYDFPDQLSSLMVVGHNPSVTNFVNMFLENKIDALPTSGVVALEFKSKSWKDLTKVKSKVNFIIFPKMLS